MIKKLAILLIACITGIYGYAQHSFTVDAPSVVAQGENFQVRFIANASVESFQQPQFSGANILVGPSPSRYSSTQIINGKRTDSEQVSYTYVLQATGQSPIIISPASATIEGTVYSTGQVNIEVVKTTGNPSAVGNNIQPDSEEALEAAPDKSTKADVFLKLQLSKSKVVKGEPLMATLKIYTKNDITGFEDVKFPVFNGFFSQEIATPQNITFARERVGDQIYSAAILRKYMLIPQQTGNIVIEPAEIVVGVRVIAKQRRGRSFFDDFFDDEEYAVQKKRLTTGRLTLNVSGLPSGAPESFSGGVGKFNMNVKLPTDSLRANEASSITIEITGAGNLNLVEAPKIELPSDFEKYDTKTTNNFQNGALGVAGKKTFEYPFIPRSGGEYEIPKINFTYYDIEQKKYITLSSATTKCNVAKGNSSKQAMYAPSSDKRQVKDLGQDIRYIHNGAAHLEKQDKAFIFSWLFYAIAAFLIIAFFAIKKYIQHQIALRGDFIRSRFKKADKMAKSRLRVAGEFMRQNRPTEFYEELHKALLGYISDKLSLQFASMQKETIENTLKEKGVEPSLCEAILKLIEDCEMVRYSKEGASSNMESIFKQALDIIRNLGVK